ncbi:hypothetical protein K431DRAFT_281681 [Polychaeton citri CBS 116435]|uniref:CENP-V/GFA domain-containing protein n=1 Tax=Polychaeton citri CBS 116435 TaxID=1314669 RepID=A0A9P4QEF9_9PEZI|nr:hypothetical protein K431DRAFT_281681 [Polychaeton citri CBS 116435]
MDMEYTPDHTGPMANSTEPPTLNTTGDAIKLTATCMCKSIQLTLQGLPSATWLCHCCNCRKLTGTLFATQVSYKPEQVTLVDTHKSLHKYSFEHPDHPDPRTAPKPNTAWCGRCGCPVWCDLDGYGGIWYLIRYGLIDAEDEAASKVLEGAVGGDVDSGRAFRPGLEFFCKRKPGWAKEWKVEGARQMEEMKL